jgi:asparagine synthase (glutamine-hydrolysing)
MCGIFGILRHDENAVPPAALLRETALRLSHRGPDDHGIHAAAGVGLVHTRLSLVDLNERSKQPFWDADHRYCLLYNGELYDYAGLRAELERAGARFRTTSDTEVLLEALLRLGVEATLRRIEGMFAFALYDSREESLVLGRDRFGIKPLYVYDGPDAFVFSSTGRAMKGWVPLRPDPLMVSAYLQGFNGPMSGRSFYERVEIVPPGAIVTVARGQRPRYHQCLTMGDLSDPEMTADFAGRPHAKLVDHVEDLLVRSVEMQLLADVPVGSFCSGGVDSSLLLAIAARSHGDISVFHADVVGPLSEREAAQRLAEHLKLDLKVATVRDDDFLDLVPEVTQQFGFPFMNATTVPLLLVSRLTREHGIKAVLTGEGADECFLGYEWLQRDLKASIRNLPGRVMRRLGLAKKDGLPSRDRELIADLSNRFEIAMGPPELPGTPEVQYHAPSTGGLVDDSNLSYILRTLLHRNDAMGMAASIEARFPFLDSKLVRASAALPHDCKVRLTPRVFDPKHPFYVDKWILRQIADRYLPPDLSQRPKGMFPTNAFQRFEIADELFENSFVADTFGLARPRLRHLLARATPALKLRLMLTEAWAHVCVREEPKADFAARLRRWVTVRPNRAQGAPIR